MSNKDGWSVAISVVALGLSGFATYTQFYPDDKTIAVLTHAEWSVHKIAGSYSPRPILGISFVNSGNRPIILSKIWVSFGYDSEFNAASNCKTNGENRWTGIPWDQNFDGDKITKSVPRSIFPQVATPTIYTFGNWPVVPGGMEKIPERSLKACLIYEAINSKGKIVKTKPFPLGVVTFTDTRITNFEIDKNAKNPVTIFD